LRQHVPIIATGHLSVSGGKTNSDDGVRETYVGSIECISNDIFSSDFDYVALGHYHITSVISDSVRYCGASISMGFGEANQQKNIILIEFENKNKIITEIPIPIFQKLESIIGNKEFIYNRLLQLKENNESIWVEIIYNGNEIFPDFAEWATELVIDTKIEILKIQNKQYLDKVLTQKDTVKTLEELNEYDVFDQLLEAKNLPEEQKIELKELYSDIIKKMNENNE
jgi:exonuclease SbcD